MLRRATPAATFLGSVILRNSLRVFYSKHYRAMVPHYGKKALKPFWALDFDDSILKWLKPLLDKGFSRIILSGGTSAIAIKNMKMRNSSFYFKQFVIFQDKCAMKVGTDGILLGSWANISDNSQILDIGTGTGLLALMMAQRSPSSNIDAVEIDEDAYSQAKENIEHSPWGDRINTFHAPIQDFANNCSKQYDLIISNPPFFEKASKSSQKSRNLARHSDSLSQTDIRQIALQLMKPNGHLAVIYPTDLADNFLNKAKDFHLFCDRKAYVKPTPKTAIKRILLELSLTLNSTLSSTQWQTQETILVVEERKHIYTQDYINLVQDFYLNLSVVSTPFPVNN